MTQQLSLFGNTLDRQANQWAETQARQQGVRNEAREARNQNYRAWFRSRAHEFGGVNDKNRAQITAEAAEYGKRAAEHVYRRNGYTPCTGLTCQNLVSPGYKLCPRCTPTR